MNELINKLPKKYQAIVKRYEKDQDGYWLYLKEGYSLEYYHGDTLIHEDTQREVLNVLRNHLKQKLPTGKGGKRQGSGRKNQGYTMVSIRMTEDEKVAVKKFLKEYREKQQVK